MKWPPSARTEQRSLQIWDWDDTLFPSTWLNGQGLRLEDDAGAAPEQQARARAGLGLRAVLCDDS